MTEEITREELLVTGPDTAERRLIFAHGAGAPMDHDWMNGVAQRLVDRGFQVIRFEFPYMRRRRATGKKKPPDRGPKLSASWRAVLDLFPNRAGLFIAGKSMGGRIASYVADESDVAGLICLGFPFHASGKPVGDRAQHLESIATPTLILQGERDPMGKRVELEDFPFSDQVTVHWLADGDHGFRPRKKSGLSLDENLDEAVRVIDEQTAALLAER